SGEGMERTYRTFGPFAEGQERRPTPKRTSSAPSVAVAALHDNEGFAEDVRVLDRGARGGSRVHRGGQIRVAEGVETMFVDVAASARPEIARASEGDLFRASRILKRASGRQTFRQH